MRRVAKPPRFTDPTAELLGLFSGDVGALGPGAGEHRIDGGDRQSGWAERYLAELMAAPNYAGELVHVQALPERSATYAAPDPPLPPELGSLLRRL